LDIELADHQRSELDRKIQTSWIAILVITSVSGVWALILLIVGDFPSAMVAGDVFFGYLISLILFQLNKPYTARLYWVISAAVGIFIGQMVATPGSEIKDLFLPVIGMPFLAFSWSVEKRTTIVAVLLAGTAWLISEVFLLEGALLQNFGLDIKSPEETAMVALGIRTTNLILLLVEFVAFSAYAARSELLAFESSKKAEASARSKGEFLANMSHEIRTPMNGVIRMIEVLEALEPTVEQKNAITTIKSSAFSLLRIIDDILDTAKMEAGKLSIEPVPSELRPIIEGVAETVRPTANHLGVNIRLWVDPLLPEWVMTDPGRLRQVLLNLISNGVKYSAKSLTQRDGIVFVKLWKSRGNHLLIEIEDNGLGMDSDLVSNLIQPFVQGESSSTRRVGGTGLGLVISRNLIEMFGGRIEVSSQIGKGSTFTVFLPLREASGPKRMPDINGLSLVWVEDDDFSVTDGIQLYFKRSGCDATFVSDIEALADLDMSKLPANTVFLIASLDLDKIAKARFEIAALREDTPIIELVNDRIRPAGLVGKGHYILRIYPMRFADLHESVHVLAHRKVPELPPETEVEKSATAPDESKTILVVEDNPIIQLVIKRQLDMLGHSVEVADDGEAGLRRWQGGSFDVVLTDCHTPIMDGYDLARAIRRSEEQTGNAAVPIIAITANALEGEAEKCYASGMNGYLTKPFSLDQLRRAINDTKA